MEWDHRGDEVTAAGERQAQNADVIKRGKPTSGILRVMCICCFETPEILPGDLAVWFSNKDRLMRRPVAKPSFWKSIVVPHR